MKRALAFGAAVLVAALAHGAAKQITVGAKTYDVDTGTAGGVCVTKDVSGGAQETVCRDGGDLAAFSSVDGCLDSSGSGYCALGKRRPAGVAGSELTCPSGAGYFLLVGPKATCRTSQGEKVCESPDGRSTARADCKSGCVETTGAGHCCEAATSDCPPAAEKPR